jgi:hypothetical protein
VYIIIPFKGKVVVARFNGNINTGIKVEVGGAFVSGSITLKYEDMWLVAVLEVKILGKVYDKTVKLHFIGVRFGKPF